MAHPFIAPGLALLFDMDGVLIQSNELHVVAWEKYLKSQGISIDARKIYDQMHGKRNDEIVADFFGRDLSPEEIELHGARKEAVYRDLMAPVFESHLTPGVKDFLESLEGVPLGVASNAEPANVDFVLDLGGLRRFFAIVVDGHQVKNPKPSPEIYLMAAERLRVDPRNCIVFEDSLTGVLAAKAAGARVAGVGFAEATRPEVDLSIQDFRSTLLIPWLERVRPAVGSSES